MKNTEPINLINQSSVRHYARLRGCALGKSSLKYLDNLIRKLIKNGIAEPNIQRVGAKKILIPIRKVITPKILNRSLIKLSNGLQIQQLWENIKCKE